MNCALDTYFHWPGYQAYVYFIGMMFSFGSKLLHLARRKAYLPHTKNVYEFVLLRLDVVRIYTMRTQYVYKH